MIGLAWFRYDRVLIGGIAVFIEVKDGVVLGKTCVHTRSTAIVTMAEDAYTSLVSAAESAWTARR